MIKFLDLFEFRRIFSELYLPPDRKPMLGDYKMVLGLLMLLFIGFNRIWHFIYITFDSMLCAVLGVNALPHTTTFWRYLDSLGINQAKPLLKIGAAIRERVWCHCQIQHTNIYVDIDTTVETVYGDQQGARKGHNTSHRGKKGFRPVLAFISETREFVSGVFRRGTTIRAEEVANLIKDIRIYLPGLVRHVTIRADGEFISWLAVKEAEAMGFDYIIGNRASKPVFNSDGWYALKKNKDIMYNECMYQPNGWEESRRFVVMRLPKDKKVNAQSGTQLTLFEDKDFKYRIFFTSLKGKPHKIIAQYDGRADAENLVGEAKREGLAAIPSAKFKNNYAYFHIVMLAYNIWRGMKLVAAVALPKEEPETSSTRPLEGIAQRTLRIARLILLLIAAKVVSTGNRTKVKYSIHDVRVSALFDFMDHIDKSRGQILCWNSWEPVCQPPKLMQDISCTSKTENPSRQDHDSS